MKGLPYEQQKLMLKPEPEKFSSTKKQDDPINRAEVATILVRMLKLDGELSPDKLKNKQQI